MMERYNDKLVPRMDGVSSDCIFVKDICSIYSIPPGMLKWHTDDPSGFYESGEYLSLQEIGEQVRKLYGGHMLPLYVWVDSPMHGEIYQTGNYPGDDSWTLLGQTKGYA